MRTATVTVVITNYNHGHLITEAVQSALAQRRAPDEVLVVDDGSTDNSAVVLSRLSSQVRVVRREHHGVVATRNAALEMVSTDWLVFLDADDLLMPEFLQRTLLAAEERGHTQLGFVYSSARTITDGQRGHFPTRRFDRSLLGQFNYVASTALLRRLAVAEVSYSSEMELLGHEDWDLYLSLVERGWQGIALPKPLFVYRRQPRSRNSESLEGWPELLATIRRRHPWTTHRPAQGQRAKRRLARIPFALLQRACLTVDRLRWAAEER